MMIKGIYMKVRHSQLHRTQNGEPLKVLRAHSTPPALFRVKPKNLLNEEMTLEEAQIWFRNYRAHLAYNKDALAKQEIQVQRAMLVVDLDPKMASALRSHEKITDETEIDANAPEIGCLETLLEIFL